MNTSGIPAGTKPASNYRWMICALLFVITTINYMDRNILGVLKPTIQGDLHFTETDFGNIIFSSRSPTPSAMRAWGDSPTRSAFGWVSPPLQSSGALLLSRTAWSVP